MGWSGTALGARDHIDDTIGGEHITHRAWTDGYGEKVCWLIVDRPAGNGRAAWSGIVAVLVKYGKHYGETWSYIKVIDEGMGPSYTDVPDKIWDNRPPLPDDASTYAVEWREAVEKHRATFNVPVKSLTDADVGRKFRFDRYGDRVFSFTGWRSGRRGKMIPTFDNYRIPGWEKIKAAESAAAEEAA